MLLSMKVKEILKIYIYKWGKRGKISTLEFLHFGTYLYTLQILYNEIH